MLHLLSRAHCKLFAGMGRRAYIALQVDSKCASYSNSLSLILGCAGFMSQLSGRDALMESVEEVSSGCAVAAIGATTGAALPYLVLARSPALILVPSLVLAYLYTGRQTSAQYYPYPRHD